MNLSRVSLNALKAFEATARLRSFSAAADELCVTHGAISRHVRSLEEAVGVALLHRNAHSTEPTPEGLRLSEGLTTAFSMIQNSIEQLRPGPLTLSCSSSVMMYWLIPRLSQFSQANPKIELRFNIGAGAAEFSRENTSVAIRLSSIEPPRDVIRQNITAEWIGPVCSPQYLRNVRLKKPDDLKRCNLMLSNTRSSAWKDWCKSAGVVLDDVRIANTFDHFYLLIQAAKCGMGVANVPRMLVRDDLNNGTLVAPLGFISGPNQLSLWTAARLANRPEVRKLIPWLAQELKLEGAV